MNLCKFKKNKRNSFFLIKLTLVIKNKIFNRVKLMKCKNNLIYPI